MTPEAQAERDAIVALLRRPAAFEGDVFDRLRLAWHSIKSPHVIATAFARQNATAIQRGDHLQPPPE